MQPGGTVIRRDGAALIARPPLTLAGTAETTMAPKLGSKHEKAAAPVKGRRLWKLERTTGTEPATNSLEG